jgi:hypothetical protein
MRGRLWVLVPLFGCQLEQGLGTADDLGGIVQGQAPDIVVEPTSIDFGSLRVLEAETASAVVTVTNEGDLDLELRDVRLVESAGTGFTLGPPSSIVLPPGAQAEIFVVFAPGQHTEADGQVQIGSNDPDQPIVAVPLRGVGVAPAIALDPSVFDFGAVEAGCDVVQEIEIRNVGDDTLAVNDLQFTPSSSELSFGSVEAFALEPQEFRVVAVTYRPTDAVDDTALLAVASNDPVQPRALATQVATLAAYEDQTDLFEQPFQPESDILFVVDNSNSMSPFQDALAANGEGFLRELGDLGADWQVGVITVDDPSLRGAVLTPATPDAPQAFADQVQAGTDALTDEYQLYRAWQTLSPGGAYANFMRSTAALSIVVVSDERAQDPSVNPLDKMSDDQIGDYVELFQSLKEDDSLVRIDVVGSPVPSGCIPAKEPGWGLDTAAALTEGVFLEICEEDWGPGLADIAARAVPDLRSFHLSEVPLPETIEVEADEAPVDAWDGEVWWYDEATNAVVFDAAYVPEGGTEVVIRYTVRGACEG